MSYRNVQVARNTMNVAVLVLEPAVSLSSHVPSNVFQVNIKKYRHLHMFSELHKNIKFSFV